MKRIVSNDDKQRTISHFFKTNAAKASKPAPQPLKAAGVPAQLHAAGPSPQDPVPKRQKLSQDSDVVIVDELGHANGHADAATLSAGAPNAGHASAAQQAFIPASRNTARHTKAQRKLVGSINATSLAEPGQAAGAGSNIGSTAPGASNRRGQQQPNYTPLEKQIVKLKEENPGVLLVVEVGYKFRFFGDDAAVAAQDLGLYCYPDHNFLTASFPIYRLPVHIRRLVAAGHKVGVVRQVESAALKAVSDNKSAPFERQMTGLFTAATLDAGEKADKLGEAGAMEASQELESLLTATAAAATNYILVIAEQQQQQNGSSSSAELPHAEDKISSSSSGSTSGILGVVAVDVGSGDIAYGLASSSSGSSSDDGSSSSDSSSSSSIVPLEAVLLSIAPADIVVVEPISDTTNRLLSSYMAGSTRRCRLERQQQQQRPGSSSQGYLDSATLAELQAFYSSGSSSSGAQLINADHNHHATDAAAAAAAAGSSDDLGFILSLPHMVLRALHGALQYLRAFGLTSVLQCTSGFRLLGVGRHMKLDGNALRQLQILTTGVDVGSSSSSVQGSLLHLLDRCSTAAGGRMLRRWCAAPLADRNLIVDRQNAVQAILSASQGSVGSSSSSGSQQLSTLRSWLKSQRTDLERCLSRITAGTAAPAEAVALWTALAMLLKSLKLPQQPSSQPVTHQLDLAALAAAVPSRLLVSLLAAAAGSSAVAAAAEVLGWLDAGAAAKNDYLGVFKSRERFPEVFKCAADVAAAEQHLHALLPQLAAAAGVPKLSYVAVQNQGSWMVELPTSRTDIPQGWEKVCGTKKVNRFHNSEVKSGVAALARAQEVQQATCQTAWQQLLKQFTTQHYAACRDSVSAIAELDALQSLADVASTPGYCRPTFAPDDEPQQLSITDGKHAMLDLATEGAAVGNSLELKWDGVRAAVITGPNMGGKSVLIRQAAITLIMAQLGSWVPAAGCHMSVFDGVFSRMGASDSLMLGRSTFAEELEDASYILQHATNRSLVIIDELGRGTATHDGVAIATATLQHLVTHKQCLTLFVTHYPEVAALADNYNSRSSQRSTSSDGPAAAAAGTDAEAPGTLAPAAGAAGSVAGPLAVYHMSYVRHDAAETTAVGDLPADTAATTAAAAAIPTIMFLYKLTPGAADASFGLNVAQMAGLPQTVVQRAAYIATKLKARIGQRQQQQQHELQGDQQQHDLNEQQQQQRQPHGLQDSSTDGMFGESMVMRSLQTVLETLRGVKSNPQMLLQQRQQQHSQDDTSAGALKQIIQLQCTATKLLGQV